MKNFIKNKIEKFANNFFKDKEISEEYMIIIILIFFIELACIFFAINGGEALFYSWLLPEFQNPTGTHIAAFTISIAVESAAFSLLWLFYKNVFERHLKTALALFAVVLVFFGGSFYSSTNGLALKQYQKSDTTALIIKNANLQTENTRTEYITRIAEIRKEIERVNANPQGWIGGKRCVLTAEQLQTIKEYNSKIFELENSLKNDKEKQDINLANTVTATRA